MSSFDPPKDPKLNDRWTDEVGDLWIWDGTEWVPFDDPFFAPNTTVRNL